MFTGIIEDLGKLVERVEADTNLDLKFQSNISDQLKIDQSLCHNGVCLTVVQVGPGWHRVIAIDETIRKTNIGDLKIGDKVNLERCVPATGRLDGHIVQGHVDTTAECTSIEDHSGSWIFNFRYDKKSGHLTVPKGSICINGVSLTVVDSGDNDFSVAIIPYTFEHTTFADLVVGSRVNLEFDIIGKYVEKLLGQSSKH